MSDKFVLTFFISKGARQIRVAFEKGTANWCQLKSQISILVDCPLDHLVFTNSSNGQPIDAEDDGSCEFLCKIATIYHHIVVENMDFILKKQNKIVSQTGLPITVSRLDGSSFQFNVIPETTTVIELKQMIDCFTGVIPHQQRIIFNGKQILDEESTLSHYGIKENSCVTLVYCIYDGIMPFVSERDSVFADLPEFLVFDFNANHILFRNKPFLFRSRSETVSVL